ncbi:MAG: WD40 repeat domain-containing protein [Methanoregula sp.]|nr:WD40 repeat domain-containing protein [Methanoregula sp.]
MKYPVSAPLIGPWLYRCSVKKLAGHARQGDTGAVRNLAGILCTPGEETVQDIARTALCSLTSEPAIDTLFREALAWDNAALYHIVTGNNFLPADPETRAVFLFVTGQREHYTQLDPLEHRPLLAQAYAQSEHRVRFQIRSAAKKNGLYPMLAEALMGTGQNGNAALWSEEEWEVVVTGLIQERQWESLWRLILHAPPHLAIPTMSAMDTAGWRPPGDEQALWEELISVMPGRWTCPVPEVSISSSKSPDSQPLHLTFSGDGSLLAAACTDGTICLWNTRTGSLIYRLPSGLGTISGLTISPDNTCLLSAETGGILQCRDTLTGGLLWSVDTGEQSRVHFSCSRNGIAVIPLSNGGQLLVVSLADGHVRKLSGGPEATVTGCALSHDDRMCVAGYADGGVGCWDVQNTHYLRTLEGLGDPVRSLSFCENDDECLVIYDQNRPTRWRITSGERIRTYTGNTCPLRCCAIIQDASMFAIAGEEDRMLRFWQAENAAPVAEVSLYNRSLTACATSADCRMLAAGCTEGTLRIYTMNGGAVLREWKAHKQAITAITLSSAGEMVASASWDGTVKLWNCTSGELVRTLLQPAGGVTSMTATPDGSTVYAGYADGKVRQVPCGTGDFSLTIDMYTNTVRTIAISPEGTLLACAGGDTSLRIWNAGAGGLVTTIEGLTTTQRCLTFSSDGKTFVSGGWDGKVRIWSVLDGSLQKILTGHTSVITALVITPDGTLLATGSNDRSVRLWTLFTGQCISVRTDSRSEVSALAVSDDGTLLAFAGTDAVIHLCYLPEGTPAPSIPALPGKITALAFAGEGRVLVAGYDTGAVAIFSCAGRHLLRTVPAHSAEVTGIAVLPGGESVLTSGLDGQVRHTNLPWTRPLSGTTLNDIPLVARYARTCPSPDGQAQWSFLHHMLTARFRNDIELCATVNDESRYDIQIVG